MKQQFMFSDKNRIITIYNYSRVTGEFIGQSDVFIPANTGLPAYCVFIAPPQIEEGHAAVFIDEKWQLIEDHRQQIVFDSVTGQPITIDKLEPLPNIYTALAPLTLFDKWDGSAWHVDSDRVACFARTHRDAFITATDSLMISDYSIDDIPLTETQRSELLVIRSAYRVWPTLENWPMIELPELPQWLLIEAVNQGFQVPVWPPEVNERKTN